MTKKIIFSAGGTGGHIFPAINLMKYLSNKGYDVLLAESKALESEYQDKESNTKSRAFLKLWPTYKSTRLNHRIKNLMD